MRQVLLIVGRPQTSKEIAAAINVADLYRRADGGELRASQVGARARNYPDIFLNSSGEISLVTVAAEATSEDH